MTSSARMKSPYHYPEGPMSSLPFNPRKKGFAVKYWTWMGNATCRKIRHDQELMDTGTFFGLPFFIACTWHLQGVLKAMANASFRVADVEE